MSALTSMSSNGALRISWEASKEPSSPMQLRHWTWTAISVLSLMLASKLLRPIFSSPAIRPATQTRAMHIQSIPMWVGSSNNYAYLVSDETTKDAVIIDPANPSEVTPVLEKAAKERGLKLTAIVNTHYHWDHAGGNTKILDFLSKENGGKVKVIGGKDCEAVTKTPAHNETFMIGEAIEVTALHTPCHTQDSICWFMQDKKTGGEKVVFTGDTLFIGGCGKFFEGDAGDMEKALNGVLAQLPDDTRVFPGHEYTKSNVRFLVTVDQGEAVKGLKKFAEENKETQGKSTIGDEKRWNAFMRTGTEEMRKVTGESEPAKVMGKLREMKNKM